MSDDQREGSGVMVEWGGGCARTSACVSECERRTGTREMGIMGTGGERGGACSLTQAVYGSWDKVVCVMGVSINWEREDWGAIQIR